MPSLALVAIGHGGRWLIPLPIPLILLWPLAVLVAIAILLLEVLLRRNGDSAAWTRRLGRMKLALSAFCDLRGLKVDVRSAADQRVLVWFL